MIYIAIASARLAAAPTLEQFTSYFTNRPNIIELIAEVDRRGDRLGRHYVLLRKQNNAFFYREAPELLELGTTNCFPGYMLAAFHDEYFWSLDAAGRAFLINTNGNESSVQTNLLHTVRRASLVLNLGIPDCLPELVTWDNISLKPYTNDNGVNVFGTLILTNGEVGGLHMTAASPAYATEYKWLVHYDFQSANRLPPPFPARILLYVLQGQKPVLTQEAIIFSLKLADTPLPRDYFLPDRFQGRNLAVIVEAKGRHFHLDPISETYQPIADNKPIAPNRQTIVRSVFAVCVMAIVIFIVLSWFRLGKREGSGGKGTKRV